MDSGAFEDEDAQAVKGLDDLGGGRVYDNAARGPAKKHNVTNTTMMILDQRNKRFVSVLDLSVSDNADYSIRFGHQFGQPASSNKKMRSDARPNNGHGRNNVPALQRNIGQAWIPSFQPWASTGRGATPSAGPDARGPKHNPLARVVTPTTRLARPRPQSQQVRPLPDMVVDPNASLPFDLGHILFRTPVRFLSRDINPASPALIVLSARSRPELGLFTVVIYNRIHHQWSLSSWSDYYTDSNHSLVVTFQGNDTLQGYQLFFESDSDLRLFVTRIRSFLAGEYADQSETASTLPQAAASVSTTNPAVGPNVRLPHGTAVPVMLTGQEVPRTLPRSIPATPLVGNQGQAISPAINGSVASVPATRDIRTPDEPVDGSDQQKVLAVKVPAEHIPVKQVGESDQDTLINLGTDESGQDTLITLGTDEADAATLQSPSSSAAEELSTLEPYDYGEATSTHVSRDDIIATARVLLEWFLDSKVTGRTAGELVQTVEGIRAGVLQHIAANARAQGLGDQRIEELKRVVNDIFEAKIRERRAAMEADMDRRIQYTADDMLAMRDAAASPPDWLADIPYLPKRGSRSRQTSGSFQGTVFTPQATTSAANGDKPKPASTQSQVLRSASNAMRWVLGGTAPSNPQPEAPKPASDKIGDSESEQVSQSETPAGQTVVPDAAGAGATQDSGLQSSRWASGAPQRQHANYFTGPRYEKVWSRRSYLEDLAQLDPETKVDAEPEDLLDFYVPISNGDEASVGSAEAPTSVNPDNQVPAFADAESGKPQTPGNRDSQVPTSSGTGSGAAIIESPDNIEFIRMGISRLSIYSPKLTSSGHGRVSAQPSSSVIQASQELRAQIDSLSTQPAMVPAARAISLQLMAPPQSASASSARLTTLPAGQNGQRSLHVAPSVSVQPSVATTVQPPRPEQTQARATASQATASAQSATSARPAATQAARPGLRGLGASRHSSGAAPSSAGKFNFHLPPSARK
jgi:hypothetical protein